MVVRARALLLTAAFIASCSPAPQPNAVVTYTPPTQKSTPLPVMVVMPPASAGSPLTVVVAPPSPAQTSSTSPVAGDVSNLPDRRRFYPAADDATEPRARKKTAVLLFAAPGDRHAAGEDALAEATPEAVRRLTFEPVLCVLDGKLAAGLRCAEAMPAKATVRVTGGGTMEVLRRTAPFKDEAGHRTLPAPYAPSCCMYNTCVGKTIPYAPADDGMTVLHTHRTVLAVWPKDAEIDLQPETADTFDRSKQPVWQHAAGGGAIGAREYLPIATADMDGDRKREVLVYERWANDYALFVVPREGDAALFRFSCGNI